MDRLTDKGVVIEPVRIDGNTGCRFTFFADPDGLPMELYEVQYTYFLRRFTDSCREG